MKLDESLITVLAEVAAIWSRKLYNRLQHNSLHKKITFYSLSAESLEDKTEAASLPHHFYDGCRASEDSEIDFQN